MKINLKVVGIVIVLLLGIAIAMSWFFKNSIVNLFGSVSSELSGGVVDQPSVVADEDISDQAPKKDAKNSSSIVDDLLDKMSVGNIAFNAPVNLNIAESARIQLILSPTKTIAQLKQSITEAGRKEGAEIKMNDRMEARLSGNMFTITEITPAIQAVSESGNTEWKWEIVPKESGLHSLDLTLNAFLTVGGISTPRTIKTYSKTIEVNVTTVQKIEGFVSNNWQWLWAAVLVPIVGWLWKKKSS